MAKTTVEFNDAAAAELARIASVLQTQKADVLRAALSLYAFIVDELSLGDTRQLGIIEDDQVRKVIVVPGLQRKAQQTVAQQFSRRNEETPA